MYYLSAEDINLRRLQGVFVSKSEIRKLTEFWRNSRRTDLPPEEQDPDLVKVPQPVTETVMRQSENFNGTLTQLPLFNEPSPQPKTNDDRTYEEAVKLVQREGRVSANILVSKMGIGFGRANKFLTRMEEDGIIGPASPNRGVPREILDYGKYGPANDGEKD